MDVDFLKKFGERICIIEGAGRETFCLCSYFATPARIGDSFHGDGCRYANCNQLIDLGPKREVCSIVDKI